MTRNRLYLLLFALLGAGYGWMLWANWHIGHPHGNFTPCFIKNATGIACPSCGTTRSILLLSHGNIKESLLLNPLGIIMGGLMVVLPFWLAYDVLAKRGTLYKSYNKFENTVRIRWVAIVLTILILLNWIWNIQKGL